MNPEYLMTDSLRNSPQGERVARIMAAALEAVNPTIAVENYLQRFVGSVHGGTRLVYHKAVEVHREVYKSYL